MGIKQFFLMALCVLPFSLQADITQASFFKRETSPGDKQYIAIYADIHSTQNNGFNQVTHILDLCSTAKQGHLIVEDVNDLDALVQNALDYATKGYDQINVYAAIENIHDAFNQDKKRSKEQRVNDLLYIISSLAQDGNVTFSNVDFRAFLLPDAMDLPGSYDFLSWRLKHVVQSLQASCDHQIVQTFSDQHIKQFLPFMIYVCKLMRTQQLQYKDVPQYLYNLFLKHPEQYDASVFLPAKKEDNISIHDTLQQIIDALKKGGLSDEIKAQMHAVLKSELEYAFYFAMTDLIDVSIIQEIYKRQIEHDNNDFIAVCAGQAHTEQIEALLPDLGYEKITTWNADQDITFASFCTEQAVHMQKQQTVTAPSTFFEFVKGLFRYTLELFSFGG